MKPKQISRRQLLELGAAATVGAIVNNIDQPSSHASTHSANESALSGLAAEYDQYDGLGLAALVAKRQVTPRRTAERRQETTRSYQSQAQRDSASLFRQSRDTDQTRAPGGAIQRRAVCAKGSGAATRGNYHDVRKPGVQGQHTGLRQHAGSPL